jgi:hypothetical protein
MGVTDLVEKDSGNEASNPFRSMDELSQVREGKGEIKERRETESLQKWGVDLSDEVAKIKVYAPEREPPEGGQRHRWSHCEL